MNKILSCIVQSEKQSVKGWHCLSIKRYYLFYGIHYLVRGAVIFHMVKKKQTTSSRKTYFMTFGNYNLNRLLGLSAAGLSVFFIDNVPLLKPLGVK